MNRISILAGAAALALTGLPASAAFATAIAPKAKLTDAGKSMNFAWKGPCPDVAAVGAPAFPGSVCIKAAHYSDKTAFVDLLSNANPGKVESWYAAQLTGWTRVKTNFGYPVFTPPGGDANAAMVDPTADGVAVEPVTAADAKVKKMIYVLKGTPKTNIMITYALK